jgi:hypothetical protein
LIIHIYGNGNINHQLGTGYLYIKRNSSAIKRVEFISDRMSYIILRRRWFDIVQNVNAQTDDKSDDKKDGHYEKPEHVLDQFLKYYMKILL